MFRIVEDVCLSLFGVDPFSFLDGLKKLKLFQYLFQLSQLRTSD